MKLVIAIVNKDDSSMVSSALLDAGYPATKMASTGGFLRMGNTTFLVGVEEDRVAGVLEIIKLNCSRRMQLMNDANMVDSLNPASIQVTVGGATVFVVNVEQFEKL